MKLNLTKFTFPSSGYKSPWLSYWTVVALVIFATLSFFVRDIYKTADTREYYEAGDMLFRGLIHESRPPVFPAILYVFKMIFGYDGSKYAVIGFHALLSVVSTIYINKSIRLIVPENNRLCFWMTVAYVILPFMYRKWWLMGILTDSLALIVSALLIYNIIRVAQSKTSFWYSIWTSWWLLILVFLRPILMCYIPVVIIFWFALYMQRRKTTLKLCACGLGGVAIIIVLLVSYMHEVNRLYHIHTMTSVSIANNYTSLRYGGVITPEDTDYPAFQEYIAKRMSIVPEELSEQDTWTEIDEVKQFPLPVIEKAVNHAVKHKHKAVMSMIIKRFINVTHYRSRMAIIELFYLFAGCILLIYTFRQRKLLLIPSTLFLFVSSVLAATFLGAPAEWERISSPMFPMLVLFVGWAFSKLRLTEADAT